ncbi:hypothetical protein EDD93_1043 [Streptomyces sp. 840.1]|uniref:hypothetical protein n=1 Tax=Streptomyces sp. 840.1 TaxID=2485152 RepID=UPI000F4971D5|nr:hypothetical protein [Streptomyces sp. 840.1]ROQ66635.1 hypothetical protein EDD93_1043 [Streptomyces sp. 840.1]
MTNHNSAEPAGADTCRVCQEFDLAEAVARSERDESRATDCRVLRRRHRAAEHGEHAEHGEQP